MNAFAQAFTFIGRDGHVLLSKLGVHVIISVESIAISILIGLPLGAILGHFHKLSFLAINISNLGRALPSLAVLSILLPVLGIGRTDVIVALVVLAAPPILTNAYVAVDGVDNDTVEAARGIGMRPWQVLMKVELPLALPLIFAGIRTSAVFVVATATLAGFFGGGGLGDIIANEPAYRLSGVIAASYVLIALAFASQVLLVGLERLITPAGLRPQRDRRRRRRVPTVPDPGLVQAG